MKVWSKNAPNSVATLLSGANLCASRFHPTQETVVAYGGAGEWRGGLLVGRGTSEWEKGLVSGQRGTSEWEKGLVSGQRHLLADRGCHPFHLRSPHRPPDSRS